MEAYCVKCKAKREMKDPALSGTCAVCGTRLFKIGKGSASGSASR